MDFLAIFTVCVAIFGHNFTLWQVYSKTPGLFFSFGGFHQALLRLDGRVLSGLTFLAAFVASLVVASLGVFGRGLAVAVLVAAIYGVTAIRKVE